jgi:hypothetical protein
MEINRYLDDKAVTKGDRLFNNQGEAFEFVNFEGSLLTAISSANLTVRKAHAHLGCYVLNKNRTGAGIAKERLRSYVVVN